MALHSWNLNSHEVYVSELLYLGKQILLETQKETCADKMIIRKYFNLLVDSGLWWFDKNTSLNNK